MINVRKIDSVEITDTIKKMFLESAYNIGDDVYRSICEAKYREESIIAKEVLNQLIENYNIAKIEKIPICQDTGY